MLVSTTGATKFVLADGNTHLIPRQLAKIVPELDPAKFVRVSRGTIVRIDSITDILRGDNDLFAIKVAGCNEAIAVSRNRILFLKQVLDR